MQKKSFFLPQINDRFDKSNFYNEKSDISFIHSLYGIHILSLIDGQKIYIEKEDSIKENEKLSTTKMFYDDVLYALNYVQFSCNIFFYIIQ